MSLSKFPEPLSVTICTGGKDDLPHFKAALLKRGEDIDSWTFTDLTKSLTKDPRTSVEYKTDCKNDWTTATVMGQDNFSQVVVGQMELAVDGKLKQFLHCHTGWHRASVSGKVLESNLNSIAHVPIENAPDDDRHRVFNAQWFGLHKCQDSWTRWATQVDNACAWSDFALHAPIEGPMKMTDLFGHRACQTNPKAHHGFYEIGVKIDSMFCRMWKLEVEPQRPKVPVINAIEPADVVVTPDDSSDASESNEPEHSKSSTDIGKIRKRVHALIQALPKEGAEAKPEAQSKGKASKRRTKATHDAHVPKAPQQAERVPPPAPPPPVHPKGSVAKLVPTPPPMPPPARILKQSQSSAKGDTKGGQHDEELRDTGKGLPDWASFEPNVEQWWELLDEYRVDHPARMMLFGLAQQSSIGFHEAMTIIMSIIRKKNDNKPMYNASGYVYSSCLTAQTKIDSGAWRKL